jgi:hypothetical protein
VSSDAAQRKILENNLCNRKSPDNIFSTKEIVENGSLVATFTPGKEGDAGIGFIEGHRVHECPISL